MKTNWVLSLWIVALLTSTSLNLVDCAPAAEYEASHHERNIRETSLMQSAEQRSSPSFFRFLNFFPSFMRIESSPPINTRFNTKDTKAPESPAGQLKQNSNSDRMPINSSETNSSSKNRPSALMGGSEFGTTNHVGEGDTSLFSEDSSFASPSLGSSQQSAVQWNSNAQVSSSTFTATGNAAHERNAGDLQMSEKRILDKTLGDMKVDSELVLRRHEMPVAARTRAVLMDQITSKRDGGGSERNRFNTVSKRIRAYAEKASSASTEENFVTIGGASIPREKVAAVGDVDGNKIQDYIVTNVGAKNYSGTVRLYLMGEDDKFLYTRDLVPGNWGFNRADLLPGDRYGTSVFRLPNAGNSPQCFIAITAPGDRTMNDVHGAVYILELSKKGNVNNHRKLSAMEFLTLVEEQKKEEQNMSDGQEQSEQDSHSSQLQELQHLNGVTSMVFFNASGGVQAVINVKSPKDKDLLHNIDKHLQQEKADRKKDSVGRRLALSRIDSDRSCLFNETHCDCKPESNGEDTEDCYEISNSKEQHGRVVCQKTECAPTYKCSCDGNAICWRIEEMKAIYVARDKGQNGEIYCTLEKHMVSRTIPVAFS